MSGAFFETYAVTEILKSYYYSGLEPNVCYYRDKDKREIDLLLFFDDKIVPIEIKKSAKPARTALKNFEVLRETPYKLSAGGIVCLCKDYSPIDENNWYIPVNVI